jgi:hypothetical protein
MSDAASLLSASDAADADATKATEAEMAANATRIVALQALCNEQLDTSERIAKVRALRSPVWRIVFTGRMLSLPSLVTPTPPCRLQARSLVPPSTFASIDALYRAGTERFPTSPIMYLFASQYYQIFRENR